MKKPTKKPPNGKKSAAILLSGMFALRVINQLPMADTAHAMNVQPNNMNNRLSSLTVNQNKVDNHIVKQASTNIGHTPAQQFIGPNFRAELARYAKTSNVTHDDTTNVQAEHCWTPPCHSECYSDHSDCGSGTFL